METTLFNILGIPVAYISFDDDLTIYMWDGTPVCYLCGDLIYGFNGKHLGWYDGLRVYDLNGFITGFNKDGATVYVSSEPYKSYKKYKPYRSYRQYPNYRPFFSSVQSPERLEAILVNGIM